MQIPGLLVAARSTPSPLWYPVPQDRARREAYGLHGGREAPLCFMVVSPAMPGLFITFEGLGGGGPGPRTLPVAPGARRRRPSGRRSPGLLRTGAPRVPGDGRG